MAFASLKDVLKDWSKKRKLVDVVHGDKIIDTANQYLIDQKKWTLDLAKAISFSRGTLTIQCRKTVVRGVRDEERRLKVYLQAKVPGVRVGKITLKII
jgi:hypothetical protein